MVLSKAEEGEMLMSLKDWKKAVRTPPSFRVGKNAQRQTQLITVLCVVSLLLFLIFYNSESNTDKHSNSYDVYSIETSDHGGLVNSFGKLRHYNRTYPLTKPGKVHDNIQFKIGLVSDMDHSSRSKIESNTWISYYLLGTLTWNPLHQTVSVTFDKNNFKTLKTTYSRAGRGMELSELVTFDGKLITFDDRGGIVFKIEDDHAYPWVLLADGNGKLNKGFKAEWATVKDDLLYVGSMGKEWTTTTGEYIDTNPMWIKTISPSGEVEHIDWKDNYIALRRRLGIEFPGYLLHESAVWSQEHKKWVFLPRRMSLTRYNEETDETQGTNILLMADEKFQNIEVEHVGEVLPTHGFSSFKFIPGTKDQVIVALKTVEHKGQIATYIMAFTIKGKILLGETKIDDTKYEGFEFI